MGYEVLYIHILCGFLSVGEFYTSGYEAFWRREGGRGDISAASSFETEVGRKGGVPFCVLGAYFSVFFCE